MRVLVLGIAFTITAVGVADYTPPYVIWKGWKVESSEFVFKGNRHYQYPLTYLVDNDPKTAWVFCGKVFAAPPEGRQLIKDQWHGDYGIAFEPEKPVQVDQLRIMNGYNKSLETFLGNDRVAEMEIYSDKRESRDLVKRVSLTDKMGWHTVSIPSAKYRRLSLVFTKFYGGKVRELCISGVELWNKKKRIDLHLPKLVLGSEGDDCGCFDEAWLMTISGQRISHDRKRFRFNPSHTLVAGIANAGDSRKARLWVYDVRTGKRIVFRKVPPKTRSLVWVDDRKVRVAGKRQAAFSIPK